VFRGKQRQVLARLHDQGGGGGEAVGLVLRELLEENRCDYLIAYARRSQIRPSIVNVRIMKVLIKNNSIYLYECHT
jgi:hypothetical protein